MTFSSSNARRAGAVAAIGFFACLAGRAAAIEPQSDFVFEALGPMACEMPPAGFDISQFRTFAENTPDAPITRGQIAGGLATSFAGGGFYGADDQSGFVVGVQGMLFDDAPELTMLCLVLVRLGNTEATAGPIVGEDGLDSASDGSFFGVFKLVQRNADGVAATTASGSVETGTARFEIRDGILVNGTIALEGSLMPAGDGPSRPFSATIDIPRAENVIRPVLRLNRS